MDTAEIDRETDDWLYRRTFSITVWNVPVAQNCNAINTMSSGSKFLFAAVFRFGKMSAISARKYNNYDGKIQSTTIQVKFKPFIYSMGVRSNLNVLINFSAEK